MTPDFTAGDPGPGLVAFLVVLFLCVATALLLWSMIRQMRKVPKDLDVPLHPRGQLPPLVDPSTGAGRDDVELPVVDPVATQDAAGDVTDGAAPKAPGSGTGREPSPGDQ
jgi:hypothetical protein